MPKTIKTYFSVTKPGIVLGNLISAAGGFFLASRGRIDPGLLFSVVLGISLVVASGCVFNNCADRDIDRKMARTCGRALVRGLMSPQTALFYASLLAIAGTLLLMAAANPLCVAVVLIGLGIYAGLYSLYLKRRSAYGIVIGSLAGAAPPLAGYCAVSGRFDTGALILLSIFSIWQIPHAYAIAVYRFDDYAAAAIPVLPTTHRRPAARKHIIGYILAFVSAASMLSAGGFAGYAYLATVGAMGLTWLCLALSGGKLPNDRIWAKKLFVFSIVAIAALSIMMSIDANIRAIEPLLLTCNP